MIQPASGPQRCTEPGQAATLRKVWNAIIVPRPFWSAHFARSTSGARQLLDQSPNLAPTPEGRSIRDRQSRRRNCFSFSFSLDGGPCCTCCCCTCICIWVVCGRTVWSASSSSACASNSSAKRNARSRSSGYQNDAASRLARAAPSRFILICSALIWRSSSAGVICISCERRMSQDLMPRQGPRTHRTQSLTHPGMRRRPHPNPELAREEDRRPGRKGQAPTDRHGPRTRASLASAGTNAHVQSVDTRTDDLAAFLSFAAPPRS